MASPAAGRDVPSGAARDDSVRSEPNHPEPACQEAQKWIEVSDRWEKGLLGHKYWVINTWPCGTDSSSPVVGTMQNRVTVWVNGTAAVCVSKFSPHVWCSLKPNTRLTSAAGGSRKVNPGAKNASIFILFLPTCLATTSLLFDVLGRATPPFFSPAGCHGDGTGLVVMQDSEMPQPSGPAVDRI